MSDAEAIGIWTVLAGACFQCQEMIVCYVFIPVYVLYLTKNCRTFCMEGINCVNFKESPVGIV